MYVIRPIVQADNAAVASLIREVFHELNIPKVGTAYADPYLDSLFEMYQETPKSAYFVVEIDGEILGAAGVGPLPNEDESICELQKMYFLPALRGKGIGKALMQICLQSAKDLGYKKCYLETMPFMESAQKLYQKSGFQYIQQPMGCTGHNACPVWMLKDLSK